MVSYKVEWKQSAIKELRSLDKPNIQRIIKAVKNLSKNPHPTGSKKLRAAEYTYRLRIGQYRVIYSIHSEILFIEIIRVGHRKNIYKNKR